MILHDLKHKEARNQSALSAICGIRCDSIELDAKDVSELMGLPPEKLREWIENVSRRFRPVWDKIKPESLDLDKVSFNGQYLCDWRMLTISDEEMSKVSKRINETIKKRISKSGNSPIVIIQSRLHEEDDPGFTFD